MTHSEDYNSFLNTLQKRGSKKFHIQHCLGSREAWKWVRKNKWKSLDGIPCDSSLYSSIINDINKTLAEELLEGHEIEFPYQMGSIKLMCRKASVGFENGNLVNDYTTDWKKTLEYWYEDKEARNSHIRIKKTNKFLYFLKYLKTRARYKGKTLYKFSINRSLRKALGYRVEEMKLKAEELIY